tara:strand:+ start:626 stop:790 length:165 start_codon:yes stop_codon:yes gene_type:complete
MSTSIKSKAFKIIAKDLKGKVVAEYLFASMKEAIKFELHMRNQKYKTTMKRVSI